MNGIDWISILVPIGVAIIASLPGLMAYLGGSQKAKSKADALHTYMDLVNEQATDMRTVKAELVLLRDEVECWRNVIIQWQAGIRKLIEQVQRLDQTPEWQPKPEDLDCLKKPKGKEE